MKKNVVYWIGVKNPDLAEKYGNFDYFEYSRATWKYWCEQNDCIFVEFDQPVESDMFRFRINWQKAIFVFDELERKGIDYDQIFLVDSSCMIKWDSVSLFVFQDCQYCEPFLIQGIIFLLTELDLIYQGRKNEIYH